MVDEGIVTFKVILMGGEKVFLKADGDEYFKTLVRESKLFFNHWFYIVTQWEPIDIRGQIHLRNSLWCVYPFMSRGEKCS